MGPREIILDTLAYRARILSLPQVIERIGSIAAGLLRAMARDGLVLPLHVFARPPITITGPLASSDPDELSRLARSRQLVGAPRSIPVWSIGRKGVGIYAGRTTPGLPRLGQADHDLAVSSIYLFKVRTDPVEAAAWLVEDCVSWEGTKQAKPDAVIFSGGRIVKAIDFLGASYGPDRVRRILELPCPVELY